MPRSVLNSNSSLMVFSAGHELAIGAGARGHTRRHRYSRDDSRVPATGNLVAAHYSQGRAQ